MDCTQSHFVIRRRICSGELPADKFLKLVFVMGCESLPRNYQELGSCEGVLLPGLFA